MKLTKKKDYEGTIRKVWTDDKSCVLGIVGRIDELLEVRALEFFEGPHDPRSTWMCIPVSGEESCCGIGITRGIAIANAIL